MRALSVKQVAEKLSLGQSTIYRMVVNGEFPQPFTIYGNRKAWLEENVDAWIAGHAGISVTEALPEPPAPPPEMKGLKSSPSADKPPDGIEAILSRLDSLIALLSRPQTELKDTLWSTEEIAGWMLLSASTVKQRVISQPGFPRPFQPGGLEHSQSRWFAGEVIRWAHEHRGKLPLPSSKGSQTPR